MTFDNLAEVNTISNTILTKSHDFHFHALTFSAPCLSEKTLTFRVRFTNR